MPPVRLFVLVLALVLLPLRGWIGGAMAVEVTPAAPSTYAAHAANPMPAPQHMPAMAAATAHPPAHCHEHAADEGHGMQEASPHVASALSVAHQGDDSGTAHDHGHCGLCQICHSVAMTDAAPAAPVAPPARVPPRSSAPHFASALLAQADKPPIS